MHIYAYGKPVLDITMPPLHHQMSWMLAVQGMTDLWALTHHFGYSNEIQLSDITKEVRYHYSSGPYQPFKISWAYR